MIKRIVSFATSILIAFSLTMLYNITDMGSVSATVPLIKQGDINNDGVVDCFDLLIVRKNINNNVEYDSNIISDYFLDVLMYYVTKGIDSFNINMVTDDDNDGITNWIETEYFKTSPNNSDTDNDGLPDKYEIVSLQSDPTVAGTDASDDADNDGLSNLEEYKNGTDPLNSDSDLDGISDYDELKFHKTNPINSDTDGDGLDDYSELQLGLNPCLSKTNGVLDSEVKIEQIILSTSDVFNIINTKDNPYEMSIKINTNGYAERELSVMESGYSQIVESDAIIGTVVEIGISGICNPDSLTIEYRIDDEYKNCTLGEYNDIDELKGIKNLCIFKYFEDCNMLLPVETKFDDNVVYTETDKLGTYCLVNLSKWFNSLDISPDKIKEELNNPKEYNSRYFISDENINLQTEVDLTYILEKVSINANESKEPVDVVFLLRNDVYSEELEKEIVLIKEFSKYVFDKCSDARIYLMKYYYGGDSRIVRTDILQIKSTSNLYATNVNEVEMLMDSTLGIQLVNYSPFKMEIYQNLVPLRDDANAYIYQLHHSSVWSGYEDQYEVEFAKSNTGIFSIISDRYLPFYQYGISIERAIKVMQEKSGLYINSIADTKSVLETMKRHFNLNEKFYKYDVLLNNHYTELVLEDELSPNNKADTDHDGISDWDEMNSDFIKYSNGKAMPCTFQEIISKGYAGNYLYNAGNSTTSREQMLNTIRSKKVFVMKSDPTKRDSDHDGLYDNQVLFRKNNEGKLMPVAPADPNPFSYTGPKNLWNEHIDRVMNHNIPTKYAENQKGIKITFNKSISKINNAISYLPPIFQTTKTEIDRELIRLTGTDDHAEQLVSLMLCFRETLNAHGNEIRPYILYLKSFYEGDTEKGAYILNFIKDENDIVYHSQPETWQREFGYTEFYDDVFRIGSYMNYGRVEFETERKTYALWTWKGDYWNLQSGAEVGLYVYDKKLNDNRYYDAVDFEIPMTLSLYNYNNKNNIETIFNWAPEKEQWWITGFNPELTEPNPEKMISVASIDLSTNKDLYYALKGTDNSKFHNDLQSKHLIFDDKSCIVWIQWYN